MNPHQAPTARGGQLLKYDSTFQGISQNESMEFDFPGCQSNMEECYNVSMFEHHTFRTVLGEHKYMIGLRSGEHFLPADWMVRVM